MDFAAESYGLRLTKIAASRPDESHLTIVAQDKVETRVSWRTLETRANQIARHFQRLGVGEGSIVALALPSCAEHVMCTLAVWKLGATLLPLRHDQPDWEMQRMLTLAAPALMVSDAHTARCPVLSLVDIASTGALPITPLEDRTSEILYLGASSGSTGQPKLIEVPFRGVVAADHQAQYLGADKTGTALVTSPLYHVNGFQFASPQLLEGSRVVIMTRFDAALAVDLIERHRVTFCVMVPTMLQRIARLPDLRVEQFASLRGIVVGGAKTAEWIVDRWMTLVEPGVFSFAYGSTERLGAVVMSGDEWLTHRGAAGRPQDVELSIRDSDGCELPLGEIGDIYMRPVDPTRRMFRYLGAPTPAATADGYRTLGDLGWLDDDGYLFIADRRTDMIISGGANVFPAEVEAALSEHPAVADQVVVPVVDADWGHRVHAIVQPVDATQPPSVDELRTFCKARLAAYKVPKSFEFVTRVPRTEAGKLNRTALGATVAGLAEPGASAL